MQEKICEHGQTHTVLVDSHRREDDEDDELPPSCGPIRIRNLEDLIRQVSLKILQKYSMDKWYKILETRILLYISIMFGLQDHRNDVIARGRKTCDRFHL